MFLPLECRENLISDEEPASGADLYQPGRDHHPILQTGSLPTETGIRKRMALSASLCAEGSALAAISGHNTICGILLILGVSVIAWSYWAESRRSDEANSQSKLWTLLIAGTTVVVGAVGLFLLVSQPHYGVFGQTGGPKSGAYDAPQRTGGSPDDSYAAVILWPKQPQQVRVISPPPLVPSIAVAQLSKPLVIPFEGVYWYLRSPAIAPGRNPHIAHGSPTKVEIHSADWHPLIMEAHQLLMLPIDIQCCRELDLSIRNADNRPGAIRIAVELIDSSSPHVQSEDLGSRPVLSSMPPEFSLDRPPANEVLKYPIPANPSLHQFNEIEVVFLPSRERSLGGVQIAVRSFRLLPSQ